MQVQDPRVVFLPAAPDGCAFYRLWMPHLRTKDSRYISYPQIPFSALAGCNVAVVQRLASVESYKTLIRLKEIGFRLIYDLDDDLWALQASNPAKNILERVHNEMIGFGRCSEEADMVTVSTLSLQSSVEMNVKHHVPVRVVNNAVEMSMFCPCPKKRNDGTVVIGWGGSATHKEDLETLGESLLQIINSVDNARLHFVGMIPDMRYVGHRKIRANGWVPTMEYPMRLSSWNWDIALAPLASNRFNRSKSGIKMMEAGAMKTPCLASDVQPYREFVCHEKELEWLLCKSPKDWLEKLRTLVKDTSYRNYLGELCYKVVREVYSMESRASQWDQVYSGGL